MNDSRFDRPAGDATGDARPEPAPAPNRCCSSDVERTQDWSGTTADQPETSWLLHWVDEKGAVVRLLTSSDPDAVRPDA
jgi:hypothetical protein